MLNPTEADLAEILSKNPDIKLRPEYRLSALRRASTGKVAITPASPLSEQDKATKPPKAKPSGDRQNQRKLALTMSESELQTSIIDLAHLLSLENGKLLDRLSSCRLALLMF